MEKANKVLWRVKAQDQLELAASALNPEEAAHHHKRAIEYQSFADQANPPECSLDPDLEG